MNIGRGRVETQFNTQRLAGLCGALELFPQVLLMDEVNRAFFQEFQLFVNGHKKLELSVHDIGVCHTVAGVVKGVGDLTDYLKSDALPELYGDNVALYDKIELHRRKPE